MHGIGTAKRFYNGYNILKPMQLSLIYFILPREMTYTNNLFVVLIS